LAHAATFTVKKGNLEVTLGGTVSPSKLPITVFNGGTKGGKTKTAKCPDGKGKGGPEAALSFQPPCS